MLVAALALALIGGQDPKPAEKPALPLRLGTSYAHPFYAFKIYLPARWQRGDGKGKDKISFYGPKDGAFIPHLDLSIETAKGELEAYVEAFHKSFEKLYPGLKVVRLEGIGGRAGEGRIFVAEFDQGGIPSVAQWCFFHFEGRRYSLGFNISKNWSERYLPAVEASMRSLRLFPLPNLPIEQQKEFLAKHEEGEAAYKKGKYSEAVTAFRRCSELLPGYPDIHAFLATVLLKQKNYADAEKSLQRALELDPDDFDYNYSLGVAALQQQKNALAIASLEKAVAMDGTSAVALANLGVAYLADDKPEKAAGILEKAVAADPESALAHYNLGCAYERSDRKDDAVREFKETLKVDPKHAGASEGLKRLTKKK